MPVAWSARRVVLIVSMSTGAGGCTKYSNDYTVESRPMPSSNPTEIVFPAKPDAVHACGFVPWQTPSPISSGKLALRGLLSMTVESKEAHSIFSGSIFDSADNDMDLFVNPMSEELGLSEVYHKKGCPVPYLASFHVHLVDLGNAQTRVLVRVVVSRVIAGEAATIGHAGSRYVYKDVPPTTIDEYRILQKIGECLHDQDMPPLVVPEATGEIPAGCRWHPLTGEQLPKEQ